MYANKQKNRRTFYIYCLLLKDKSISAAEICDKFEIKLRTFQTYIRQLKTDIELLKLPYIIRYEYKSKRYALIELPLKQLNTELALSPQQEKEVALIKIYNYIKRGAKINLVNLMKLYNWDDRTAREFMRYMAYTLREVSYDYYLYFDKNTKLYYLYENKDDSYYDDDYERYLDNVYEMKNIYWL